jgi:hypothetical protein
MDTFLRLYWFFVVDILHEGETSVVGENPTLASYATR